MTILKGFPPSNKLNTPVKRESSKKSGRPVLVGFASKGPINSPILITNPSQLRAVFGTPHPECDSNLWYAADQCLMIGEVYIIRVADQAKTASLPVPGADNLIKIHSQLKGPYTFTTNQFFKWKLNHKVSEKTLVVLASEEGLTATQLAEELNDQITSRDAIKFYDHEGCIGVRTTAASNSELELIAVQDSMYGPWSITGLGTEMIPAETIGSHKGKYNFTNLEEVNLQVVVDGSNNISVDGIVQIVRLKGLLGRINAINDLVEYINKVELPCLPGGWHALSRDDALVLRTNHSGRDAKICVKLSSALFGFDGQINIGFSPINIFPAASENDGTSMTILADSPGIEGNSTRVVIINDSEANTFTLNVYNNGIQVESWGQLTKDNKSRYYVESFVNLLSDWIKISDNPSNPASPKNGTYLLGDGKIFGAVKGCDGMPENYSDQNKVVITGLYALPDELELLAAPGRWADDVVSELLKISELHKCLAILDPPMELSFTESAARMKHKSSYGMMFWPWLEIRDTYNHRNVWVPPSGSVIAAIIRSDALSANPLRSVVPGVLSVFDYLKAEERKLNSVINPISQFTNDSFIIGGQKTLAGIDFNIKRMLLYVEKSINSSLNSLICDRDTFLNICENTLSQIKNSHGIHNYTIEVDEETSIGFRAKVGVQPKECAVTFYIDFMRVGGLKT